MEVLACVGFAMVTVVEHWSHNPEMKGSNPASSTWMEKIIKSKSTFQEL